MEKLLEYLKKQREERVKKVEEYNTALDELAAAQKRVDSFGDIGDIEAEIEELDSFICQVEGKIAVCEDPIAEEGCEESDGGVDECVVTEEE